ncbi:MAG: hypothetical protein DLM53_09925 [Candidatus Eremiobacter antarcticus]|nr:peptide ABC transporter substrate-binding protein [Candidatus Eremiobacteraeota bacterium]MBC5808572.1 peptide ABC transporter substrate-binding protein [Candidatus Eremiobacteraeota bacterium]PZR61161.1 MAG: hypothetical protein DLM53_09925 [Candidatus Eremiobacter sp. RRmetagenome_bin22]
MKRTALGAALLCAVLIGSGCTKVSTGVGTGAQQRTKGVIPHVLRYAEIAEPDNLSLLLSTQIVTIDLAYFMYSFLFNVDDHDNFVPEIATEVPTLENGGISKDGKTIIYHIRKGVKWQDGVPLTAKDVVFTFQQIMNPANNVQVRTGYDQIKDVVAPDDATVVVHMKNVFAPIIAYFMGLQGGYSILPAHLLQGNHDLNHAAWNNHPIGSGPFKFVEWKHGDHITLAANPLYWRGRPKLDKIVFRVVGDSNTIVTQLQTHEIDAWFRADPGKLAQLKGLKEYQLTLTPENVFGHVDFNTKDPVLSDVNVRRAIISATDRERIAHDATHDAFQFSDTDQSVFSWANDHRPPYFPYDPAKAAALLDQAGWKIGPDGIRTKNGKRLELQLSYIGGQQIAQALGALMQQELKAVGIALTQKPYPATIFFASAQNGGIINSGKYQLAYFGWVAGIDPDNSSLYRCNQFPPIGQNDLFWCDRALDAAEVDALLHIERERRIADYRIISRELGEQAPTMFMFSERRIDIYPKEFQGFRPSPAESANWNSYEWSME